MFGISGVVGGSVASSECYASFFARDAADAGGSGTMVRDLGDFGLL